jgi:hypothetical protein
MNRACFLLCAALAAALAMAPGPLRGQGEPVISIDKLMPAPAWALAERELLARNAEGVDLWASKYLDANGYLLGATNWGIADGPDDAVESIRNWPLAHALGGPESIVEQWDRAWEGHLDQYTKAKDSSTELASDGMYYKEFPTSYDWEHIGEGLGPFYWSGLSRPNDERYAVRLRRWAGFYMNEDPDAKNYDAKLKIIPSLFNGSKGAKLTVNTQEDWNGRLLPGTKPSARFLKATNILGDHPLNLGSTNLAFHAYLVTQDVKYKSWLLEYVDAWKGRIASNGGNIPSNIGRNGQIGGEWGGKWYGGVFGWNSPDEGVRNYVLRGPPEAFGNALMLTGDQSYTQVLRTQIDNLYANKKVDNGRVLLPRYYGDQGWYGHHDGEKGSAGGLTNLREVETDIYLWGLQPGDLERLPKRGWIGYLTSGGTDYPLTALQQGLAEIQRAASRLRADTSTADFPPHHTRGSGANPVATEALVNLTLGANDPNGSGHGPLPLHAQVRHFDPERRRAGLPQDVAALVERIRPESITLTLVNVNPLQPHTVTVQTGAYAEHKATSVVAGDRTFPIDASHFTVRLAAGSGETLTINVQRYVNQPTLAFPWDRGWMLRK